MHSALIGCKYQQSMAQHESTTGRCSKLIVHRSSMICIVCITRQLKPSCLAVQAPVDSVDERFASKVSGSAIISTSAAMRSSSLSASSGTSTCMPASTRPRRCALPRRAGGIYASGRYGVVRLPPMHAGRGFGASSEGKRKLVSATRAFYYRQDFYLQHGGIAMQHVWTMQSIHH